MRKYRSPSGARKSRGWGRRRLHEHDHALQPRERAPPVRLASFSTWRMVSGFTLENLKMALTTRDDVYALYRQLLGREPESEAVIQNRLGTPLIDVAIEFAKHQEFKNISGAETMAFLDMIKPMMGGLDISQSKAQFKQDLFVLATTGFKTGGYFVDFGAADGVGSSNSYLLEKSFGWTGICAEPARSWHDALRSNRTAKIVTDCVWKESGARLDFDEASLAEISTISSFSDVDYLSGNRKDKTTYQVDTVSLNDMLSRNGAPHIIDYLSIDTEGSELEILKAMDFSKHRIAIITVEHNFTPAREEIFELLTGQGFERGAS